MSPSSLAYYAVNTKMKIDPSLVNEYIGRPYVLNGRGPDAFDCYGLVIDFFNRVAGINIPDWSVKDAQLETAVKTITKALNESYDRDLVTPVTTPQDMDIAILKRHRLAHHVGVYVNGGILHASSSNKGVAWERESNFITAGRGQLEYLRWQP